MVALSPTLYWRAVGNVYFELTEAFNERGPVAALASGQAVVYYRVAIMSKDGDWVIRETPEACDRVLSVLELREARYRPAAPLDVRWLQGGWSSHCEFFDDRNRRVRCDFFSRPPRMSASAIDVLFSTAPSSRLLAVDVESLIMMKQTQRAKDYAVIGPLAALLSPEREIELTTDPDRIIALAPGHGARSSRPAVKAALAATGRRAVVIALAEEADEQQQRDRARVARYEAAAAPYLAECRRQELASLPLREAHRRMCDAAERWLPTHPLE
ncbi:MAG: hypothetical protein ACT4QD_00570 [Acidobacteriota bacterium]